MPNYWLMKTEPDVFSFEDLKARPKQTEPWNGVRNYQARNYMRDTMRPGDLVLFYHSRAEPPGIVGLAEIASAPYPDPSQFDPKSEYFDPKSSRANPRWVLVDVRYKADFKNYVTLAELKADPAIEGMLVIRNGQRLSIQPVEERHFQRVIEMGVVRGKRHNLEDLLVQITPANQHVTVSTGPAVGKEDPK